MVLVLIDTSYPAGRRILPSFDTHIPLKSVEVRGEIIDFVGHVKITQIFINNYPRNIEAKYLFNLTEDSTVIGMTMQIGDRVLVSHVEEKTEARATYETAISEKKTTCLLEKSSANGIYTVQVGNILQGQEIKIEIEYLAQLECSDEGEMKFVLPTNIAPKYDAGQKSIVDVMDQRNTMSSLTHAAAWSVPFTFKVDLVWRSNNQIKEVKSLTNDIAVSGIDDRTVRVVCETAPRNGDFNILVTTDVLPTLYVSQQGTDSYLMINHRIRDEVLDIEGGEYIILVDRSGSMGDNFSKWSGSGSGFGTGFSAGFASEYDSKRKIDYAREATKLFVQSLPSGCSFNVVSFGSSYQTLFPTSVEYNDLTRQQALNQIAGFEANMGGTELFQCLSDVLSGQRNRSQQNNNSQVDLNKRSWKPTNTPSSSSGAHSETPKRSSEKIVILMTDGDVGNVDAVVGLIQQYSYNSRVFTIGIGQDVNRFLCEKVAGASNACSEIMVDNPNISMVVAKMLDAATKSYYKHSTILLPQGRRVEVNKAIYPNRFVSMFHKLPTAELMSMIGSSPSTAIRLESVDGISNVRSEWTLPLALEGGVDGGVTRVMSGCIPRLYAADLIKTLEQSNGNHRHTQEIIALSCEYGIMNDRTSFVVVDERENRSIRTAPMQVTVPQASNNNSTLIFGSQRSSSSLSSSSSFAFSGSSFGAARAAIAPSSACFGASNSNSAPPPAPGSFGTAGGFGAAPKSCWGSSSAFGAAPVGFSSFSTSSAPPTSSFSSFGFNSFGDGSGGYVPPSNSFAAPPPPPPPPPAAARQFNQCSDLLDFAPQPAALPAQSVGFSFGAPPAPAPVNQVDNFDLFGSTESVQMDICKESIPEPTRKQVKPTEDILDQLINFKISDGSFTYSPQSLQLTSWTRSDILDLISSLQPQMPQMVLSESLMFNLMILKLLKEEGSKKYVMIVRNLEKWLDKQMRGSQISVPSILQNIAIPIAVGSI